MGTLSVQHPQLPQAAKPLFALIFGKNDLDHCAAEFFVLDGERNIDLYFLGLSKVPIVSMSISGGEA